MSTYIKFPRKNPLEGFESYFRHCRSRRPRHSSGVWAFEVLGFSLAKPQSLNPKPKTLSSVKKTTVRVLVILAATHRGLVLPDLGP